MKTLIKTIACLSAFYLFLMYSPTLVDFTPEPYSLPFRDFDGPLIENNKLDEAEQLFKGDISGPESMVFYEGYLYTGIEDGRIVKIKDGEMTTVAQTGKPCKMPYEERLCGRPLGLRIGKDGLLYIIDAYYGIFTMNFTTGDLTLILPSSTLVEDQRLNFPDDLDLDNKGNIYFSDASTKWTLATIFHMMFEYEAGGRIIRYNVHSGETEVLASKLRFPNGVQLSKDQKSLLICELMNRRILRYYLEGEKKGKLEVFADTLPAEPDNIRLSSRGYWVAFTSARNSTNPMLPDIVAPYIKAKRVIARFHSILSYLLTTLADWTSNHAFKEIAYKFFRGNYYLEPLPRHGIIIEFDENGNMLRSFHSPDGRISDLSEVKEHEGYLYLGSFSNRYLGRLKL